MSGVELIRLSNREYSPDSYSLNYLAAEQSLIDASRTFLGFMVNLGFIYTVYDICKTYYNFLFFNIFREIMLKI